MLLVERRDSKIAETSDVGHGDAHKKRKIDRMMGPNKYTYSQDFSVAFRYKEAVVSPL